MVSPDRTLLEKFSILLATSFMSSRVSILSMFGVGTYPSPLPKRASAPGGMV